MHYVDALEVDSQASRMSVLHTFYSEDSAAAIDKERLGTVSLPRDGDSTWAPPVGCSRA
jgi:hypothetical protein